MRSFIVAVAVGLVVHVGQVFACSCMEAPPPKEAMKNAAAVFSGTVTGIQQPDKGGLKVAIRVHERWKGPEATTLTVTTAGNTAACGYPFENGEKYLVYALGDGDSLATNVCTRTQPYESAAQDLKELGEPTE